MTRKQKRPRIRGEVDRQKVCAIGMVNINRDLRDQFKAWCARRGSSMRREILLFIERCARNMMPEDEKEVRRKQLEKGPYYHRELSRQQPPEESS